jgi:hypothetical protein
MKTVKVCTTKLEGEQPFTLGCLTARGPIPIGYRAFLFVFTLIRIVRCFTRRHLAATMAPAARQMLGRPPNWHGVTPLLIFREVSG